MMVLEGFDAPVRARLTDAATSDSRTGPASFRELLNVLEWVGRNQVHIGDVNIEATSVTDARVQVLQQMSTDDLRKLADADAMLGIVTEEMDETRVRPD